LETPLNGETIAHIIDTLTVRCENGDDALVDVRNESLNLKS